MKWETNSERIAGYVREPLEPGWYEMLRLYEYIHRYALSLRPVIIVYILYSLSLHTVFHIPFFLFFFFLFSLSRPFFPSPVPYPFPLFLSFIAFQHNPTVLRHATINESINEPINQATRQPTM
ncbi:hypothetical protein BZA77DRAFT_314570 [Pyronema omphalodes]|nr:hypothetical protein BZA77DRAFT_314570 [Pyronema omphalodes]